MPPHQRRHIILYIIRARLFEILAIGVLARSKIEVFVLQIIKVFEIDKKVGEYLSGVFDRFFSPKKEAKRKALRKVSGQVLRKVVRKALKKAVMLCRKRLPGI